MYLRSNDLRVSVRIAITTVVAVVIVYTLAGFLLTPYLLKRQIIDDLSERTGGVVTLGQLAVNPFMLSADLRQLRVVTQDHYPLFTLGSMYARLDIASLWHRGWIIRDLVFDTPHLRVDSWPEGYKKSDDTPPVSISHLRVRKGHLQWKEAASGAADEAMIDLTDLEFTLEDLGGEPYRPGQFTLAAVVNRSGLLRSSGSLTPIPVSLDATVEIDGINLADLDSVMVVGSVSGQHLRIVSALLSGTFEVDFERGQKTIRGQAGLDQLELVEEPNGTPVFSAANVLAKELTIKSTPVRVAAEVLQLDQPYLRLVRDTDGSLSGGQWLKPFFDRLAPLQPAIPLIEIRGGLLDLTDQSLAPTYQIRADHVEGSIIRQENRTTVSLGGCIMGSCTSVLNAKWLSTGPGGQSNLDIGVGNLDATVLSPYLEALTGRRITSGQMEMHLDYQATDQQFELNNKISVLGFQLDDASTNPVTSGLPIQPPLDLAVALVRDGNDRIDISIPVPAGRTWEDTPLGGVVGESFVSLVQSLIETPFYTLGKLNGASSEHLERIAFMPGEAALPMAAAGNLAILGSALVQRPGLGLRIDGRFDTVVDRQALARRQVRLHVALASSAGPPGREAPDAIDFGDSKVISVLDEFAGKRLNAAELEALRARHPQQDPAFYEAVFEALVRNEAVSRTKLKALARYRAQAIVDQLKVAGVDPQRLQIGTEIETADEYARMVIVELEIAVL